jgi:hypothetical protein
MPKVIFTHGVQNIEGWLNDNTGARQPWSL